jgi:3-phosphoshikimate 1-carboxyvinyltransferase
MTSKTSVEPPPEELLEIRPVKLPPRGTVAAPGSKSITNRALVLAALSQPAGNPCELRGVLRSEDTEVMVEALCDLGFTIRADWPNNVLRVWSEERAPRTIPADRADLFVGNSGTTMRFLTALVSLGRGRYRLDGVSRMRERPIEDLLAALRQLGVKAWSERNNGCPPVLIDANGLAGGEVRIKADISSQFLSGLLMAAPLAQGDVIIEVDGAMVSEPYVAMTVAMMRRWGFRVETEGNRFRIPGGQTAGLREYDVEPDASAASYFFGAAAITQGEATVPGLHPESLQGDVRFVDLLEDMNCEVQRSRTGISVKGRPLRGIDVDMSALSDCVMTLSAVACFASGPTTIRNVAHIRHKETDRLHALATELRRIGAGVEEFADGLKITPAPLHGGVVETYNDHRMAMSLALVGLRSAGIIIKHPQCVAKTYPIFFQDLQRFSH